MTKNSLYFYGKLLTILFCALMFSGLVSAQTGTFSGTHLPVGGQYQAAGDFNGDGRQDLVVGGYDAAAGVNVQILIGLGDGNFQTGAKYPLGIPPSGSMQNIIKGDFNGDGKVD